MKGNFAGALSTERTRERPDKPGLKTQGAMP